MTDLFVAIYLLAITGVILTAATVIWGACSMQSPSSAHKRAMESLKEAHEREKAK